MSKMNSKQIKLAKQAIMGNNKSYEKLLIQQYEYIYRTDYLYLHSQQDALEAIQEASLQGMKSISQLKNPQFFYTWYIRILIRVAGKILNERNKTDFIDIDTWNEADVSFKDETSEKIDIVNVLKKIDEKYRIVLQLFYYQEFTIKEISNLLNIPEGTVKTYLARGKQKLSVVLGGDYYEE